MRADREILLSQNKKSYRQQLNCTHLYFIRHKLEQLCKMSQDHAEACGGFSAIYPCIKWGRWSGRDKISSAFWIPSWSVAYAESRIEALRKITPFRKELQNLPV